MFCADAAGRRQQTTRNLLSQGALACAQPRRDGPLLVADPTLLPRAVEEMLRFGSPILRVHAGRRRATLELRGTQVREG